MKKLFTILGIITTTCFFGQLPSNVPTNGLVSYYSFNGNANDISGNTNNGIVNGARLTNDRFGIMNNAYEFINSSINVPMNNLLHNLPIRTFSCWFYANGNQNGGRIYETTYLNGGIAVSNGNNLEAWYYNGNYECNVTNINTGTLNQWHNLIYITNSNTGLGTIYLDGIFVANRTGLGTISPSNWQNQFLKIGMGASNEAFNGKIDDIGIWNRALTQVEITTLFTGVLNINNVNYNKIVTIYPNPASTQITIDLGNLENHTGWNIKIINFIGQEVFNKPMNSQKYVIPLNTWSSQGIYFVKIYDAQGSLVNTKKIILQ